MSLLRRFVSWTATMLGAACAATSLHSAPTPQERADDLLALVNASYQALSRVQGEA